MATHGPDTGWPGDDRSDEELSDRGATILKPCLLEGLAFQLDPYVGCQHQCCYCYALAREGGGWLRGVRTYDGLAPRLARELSMLEPQSVYVGWFSDPYQPIEAERRETRSALCVLSESGFSATILTKSDLVTRDLDVLATMPAASVGVSLAFAEERTRRLFEPGAPPNARRIEALRAARAAGIETYALICPTMPYLTDVPALLRSVSGVADQAWIYRFEVRDQNAQNWRNICRVISETFPGIEDPFVEASLATEHAYWREQREVARRAAVDLGINVRVEF
jgi:DNA repair photolyase